MHSFINSTDGFNFQAYTDYSKFPGFNQKFHTFQDNLAFQDLNNHNYMQSLTIDLTVEEEVKNMETEKENVEVFRPESPTQARDFKLICERCERSFTSKKRLQNHLEKCVKTINGNHRAFSCRECHKTFKKPSGLVKHTSKYHERHNRINQQQSPRKPSIFHSIELLSISDCPKQS